MNRNYVFDNVNEALPDLMGDLLADGEEFGSRGGRTLELTHIGITLTRPWQREIVLPERKASIAAQIAETMWVLAGRTDVDWLSHYLPRAMDFSDDGITWRAGYGQRLRNYQGVDQLAYIVDTLRASPGSRQAVAVLWDPTVDTTPGKDIACLAGETPIWSPEGDLPIEEVAAKFESGEVTRWPVYAVDPDTRQQRITWASDVWQSGVKPTICLKFDDGSNLRLTHDHRLYIKRRVSSGKQYGTTWAVSEIQAGDLRPGDRVLATRRFFGPVGHEQHKKCLDENTGFSNLRYTHQAYAELLWGPTPEGHDVHHRNEVKTDNRAENLQVLPHGEHAALNMFGDDNPMRRMPLEQRTAKGQQHAVTLTGRKHSDETRQKMSETAKRRARKNDETYVPDNHVVVAVEDGGTVPVYDFTVPGEHTALVGTGVVAHNCNNWLNFSSRLGHLDLHVGIRSNDAMWGWSGINAFEWSALQEIVAGMLGLRVGALHFSVTSFHLYDIHWQKAQRIARQSGNFMFNDSPRFEGVGDLDSFESLAYRWFLLEGQIRKGDPSQRNVDEFPEPMLRSWLRVLQWWWTEDHNYLAELRNTRLYEAAKSSIQPRAGAQAKAHEPPSFLDHVNALHAEKHAAYGDSWKRRGEYMILANIARKVDRLESGTDTSDETQTDTAIDLLVYLAKYRCWLNGEAGDPYDVEKLLGGLDGSTVPTDPTKQLIADFSTLETRQKLGLTEKLLAVDEMLPRAFALAKYRWS